MWPRGATKTPPRHWSLRSRWVSLHTKRRRNRCECLLCHRLPGGQEEAGVAVLTPGRCGRPGQGQAPRTHMAAHLLGRCWRVTGLHRAPWRIKQDRTHRARWRCTRQAPRCSVCSGVFPEGKQREGNMTSTQRWPLHSWEPQGMVGQEPQMSLCRD